MITWERRPYGVKGVLWLAFDEQNTLVGQVVRDGRTWMVNTHAPNDGRDGRAGLVRCKSLRDGKRRVEEARA